MQSTLCHAISFGKYAITNPDLPNKIAKNEKFNTNFDDKTYYGGDEKGYTTYWKFSLTFIFFFYIYLYIYIKIYCFFII